MLRPLFRPTFPLYSDFYSQRVLEGSRGFQRVPEEELEFGEDPSRPKMMKGCLLSDNAHIGEVRDSAQIWYTHEKL